MGFDEYVDHDGTALAELVARGEVTPAELLATAIARMDAVDGTLNAVVLRHLEHGERRAAMEPPSGRFQGVPFLLKDLHLSLTGTRTTNGSRLFADDVAQGSDVLTERYEAAGLVIFGKTASPEFGMLPTTESALHGATRNPWNPERTPGGSSGGTVTVGARSASRPPAAASSDSSPRAAARPWAPRAGRAGTASPTSTR
jgi:amidase/6-aminohexanoate-cyclic-dimer hydrolase